MPRAPRTMSFITAAAYWPGLREYRALGELAGQVLPLRREDWAG